MSSYLKASGRAPEQVAFRLAVSARPELPGRTGDRQPGAAQPGCDLSGSLARAAGKQLALLRPAHIALDLHEAPIVDVEHLTPSPGRAGARRLQDIMKRAAKWCGRSRRLAADLSGSLPRSLTRAAICPAPVWISRRALAAASCSGR